MKIAGITIGKSITKGNSIEIYKSKNSYTKYALDAGFLPVFIPYLSDDEKIRNLLSRLDVLILSGGNDISPFTYGEDPKEFTFDYSFERDESEFKIAKIASELNIPTLAICRGFQLVNILYGGTIHQELTSLDNKSVVHRNNGCLTYHFVEIQESKIQKALNVEAKSKIIVNSQHHQGINKLGIGLKASSYSNDGLIESFEPKDQWNMLAVQWHPESLSNRGLANILKYLGDI